MTLLAFLYTSLCPFSANVEYRFYQIPLLKIETKHLVFTILQNTKAMLTLNLKIEPQEK